MVRTAVVTWLAPVPLPDPLPLSITGDPFPAGVDPVPADDDPFPVDDDPFPVAGGSSLSKASPTLLPFSESPMLPIGTSLRVSVMNAFFGS
ncbi:hypothetical protein D3C71_1327360 [compost metagenome]